MPPRIFLSRSLPDTIMARLADTFELVQAAQDIQLSGPEILALAADCDGMITMLSDPIDRAVLAGCPKLKVVANYAVGTNNIDLDYARSAGITVTNTPDVLTEATADQAFALMLAVARRTVEGDKLVRSGRWTGWAPTQLLGSEILARRLGIIGMGRIGQAVARRAQGFGMDIVYHNRNQLDPTLETTLSARYASLDELLASSDFISLHCPLTDATRELLDKAAFDRIKHGAYLINTARGEVVDQDAMLAALSDGRLTGAGLDVYTGEPALHPRLLELENVVLAPHTGSATYDTRNRMGEVVLDNVAAVLAGRTPPNPVG